MERISSNFVSFSLSLFLDSNIFGSTFLPCNAASVSAASSSFSFAFIRPSSSLSLASSASSLTILCLASSSAFFAARTSSSARVRFPSSSEIFFLFVNASASLPSLALVAASASPANLFPLSIVVSRSRLPSATPCFPVPILPSTSPGGLSLFVAKSPSASPCSLLASASSLDNFFESESASLRPLFAASDASFALAALALASPLDVL